MSTSVKLMKNGGYNAFDGIKVCQKIKSISFIR